MKTLEQEAEEYFINYDDCQPFVMDISKDSFIAGANSKWAQAEKIKAQIEILKKISSKTIDDSVSNELSYYIDNLEQQLKQLEDEK